MKKFFSILLSIIIIAGVVLFLVFYKEPPEEEPESPVSLKVYYQDNRLKSPTEIIFVGAEPHTLVIECSNSYSARVIFNKDKTFNFNVDGVKMTSSDVGEITKYFNLEVGSSGLTLHFGVEFSLLDILKEIFKGSEITLSEDVSTDYIFLLELYDLSTTERFNLAFNYSIEPILLLPGDIYL